jgi:hypothetical protein
MGRRWARLSAALFLVGLIASRLGLVLHELAGHGGAAALLGGKVVAYRLFLFGGGWVRYEAGPEYGLAGSIAVSLAGIAVEIAAGAAALLLAGRVRAPLARLALVGFAAAALVHAGFYLAAGTHVGYGDGSQLHAELGAARGALVWPAAAAVVVIGLVLARRMAVLAGDWVGARSRAGRVVALVSAAAAAALAHGALTVTERALVRDETYGRIMKPDGERRVDREIARIAAEARAQGAPLGEGELAAVRAALERRQRSFPLIPVLAILLTLACVAGVWLAVTAAARSPDEAGDEARGPPSWRALAPLAGVAAASVALVAGLDALQ